MPRTTRLRPPGAGRAGLIALALLVLACGRGDPPASTEAGGDTEDIAYAIDFDAVARRVHWPEPRGRRSDEFPNIELTNQHGEKLRFYDDVVRDRSVIVNFMYTTCPKICPGTMSHLVRLHGLLGERVGTDLSLVSISIDPEVDTPAKLHGYWEAFGSLPGWHYLTGSFEEIELLRHRLGVYDLDPVIDADKTEHAGILTFGNDAIDRWAALPALTELTNLGQTVVRFTAGGGRGSTLAARAPAPRIHRSAGVVRSIDIPNSALTIEHEEIPGLMPAMTMAFDVEAGDALAALRPGQRVAFGVVHENRRYRIVEVAPD